MCGKSVLGDSSTSLLTKGTDQEGAENSSAVPVGSEAARAGPLVSAAPTGHVKPMLMHLLAWMEFFQCVPVMHTLKSPQEWTSPGSGTTGTSHPWLKPEAVWLPLH
eukprot:1715349-Amphidinium_carterae.1